MTTDNVIETEILPHRRDDLLEKVRRMTLSVPAIALLVGIVLTAFEPRYGLFAPALVLGWTRLVSL